MLPIRSIAFATLTALACSAALAQWQWLDNTGRKVFSDMPPPAGTPDKNILKTPGPRTTAAPTPAAAPTAATTPTVAAPRPLGRDDQLEAKKKQAEEAERTQRKAETDRLAKARADNCERAQRAQATLNSGIRIATTNARGEREIMDDAARSSEATRLEAIVRSDCGPMPQ